MALIKAKLFLGNSNARMIKILHVIVESVLYKRASAMMSRLLAAADLNRYVISTS